MAGGQLQSRVASTWRRVRHHFAVAGFVALRRRKGRLAESAGKAARRIEWSQKYGRREVDREWQITVQGMTDQVGRQQRDVVLPDDSAASSSVSHSWRILCGGIVVSFLFCIVLIVYESLCEMFR